MKKVIPKDSTLIPDEAKKVFSGIIFDTYHWEQKLYDGTYATFEMLKRPDTINVVCIDDGKILLLDEEQPHHGHRLNVPLGRVDAEDKSTLEAAQREVLEETGYEFHNWRLIVVSQFYTKIEWFMYVYVAWDVKSRVKPKLDAGEKITLRKESLLNIKNTDLYDLSNNKQNIFNKVDSVEALQNLPEFIGTEVDR